MQDLLKTAYAFLADHPGTLTFVVCFWYFALLVYARRRMVFALDEQELGTEATKLLAHIDAWPDRTKHLPEIESARKLIVETIERFDRWTQGPLERWFASGAHVLAFWDTLHEAKRLMIAALTPEELDVRLRAAAVELRHVKAGDWADEATALAGDIEAFQGAGGTSKRASQPKNGHGEVSAQRARALLGRALRILYSVEGAANLENTDWHNKCLWISTSSLLFIVVLGAGFGHPRFLLLGALGGFLSKLVRLRTSKDVPHDYDSYWATFFFSGPLGALIGWTGLMLVYVLKQANLLGQAFGDVSWTSGTTPGIADAAAFLLGFSATLFEQVITRSEGKARERGATKGSAPAPAGAAQLIRRREAKGGKLVTRRARRHGRPARSGARP